MSKTTEEKPVERWGAGPGVLKCSEDPYSKINPSPGMARLIATYERNKARRLAREKAQKDPPNAN